MIKKIFLIIVLSAFLFSLSASDLKDGNIKLTLHDDIGRFSLYYLTDETAGKYLPLFVDQDPRTTTLSMVVNNKVYRLGDSSSFKENLTVNTDSAQFSWTSQDLQVTEDFSFITSLSSIVTDGIKITITVKNISDEDLEVGLRYIFDTYLSEDSSSHFRTNASSQLTGETAIGSGSMVDYWASLKDDKTGFMVMTKGFDLTVPDNIVFANWKRLNDTSWTFNAVSSRNFNLPPYSINDSAVCHYYYPRKVLSGNSFEVVILMGNWADDGYSFSFDTTKTSDTSAEKEISFSDLVTKTPEPSASVDTTGSTETSGTAERTAAVKSDLTTVKALIAEVNKKISSGDATEDDIALLEKVIKELKVKLSNYSK